LKDDVASIFDVAVVLGSSILFGVFGIKAMDAAFCNADSNSGDGLVGSDAR
jgi:hypothetical protein